MSPFLETVARSSSLETIIPGHTSTFHYQADVSQGFYNSNILSSKFLGNPEQAMILQLCYVMCATGKTSF